MAMDEHDKVNVLLVDDQPAKLLSYEVMLGELGENLIKTSSAKQALETLLKTDVAVVLIDVCMPELDGFELATMIRDHPRFSKIAIIFVSAIHLTETDHLRGYNVGAVDYVPVPVVPEVLRAKVRVFAELYRKTKQLEELNATLEMRIVERTAELEAAAEHKELLAREVDHRARNALAVVQSIVRLTQCNDKDSYVEAVDGRIRALAKAHDLLSESRWQGADIARLVAEETAPYSREPGQISIDGPSILLQADKAQSIALVLHELATNAAKYGALSMPDGRLTVDWQLGADGLTINWSETGGPRVQAPEKSGFGSRIIDTVLRRQHGGTVDFDWQESGLACRILIPSLKARAELAVSPSVQVNGKPAGIPGGRAVLLVEDEALVAVLLEEFLSDMGFSVIGPFSQLPPAIAAAQSQACVAAVLDVNLNGVAIYPLAEVLAGKSVPFVFVTGYAGTDIDRRFSHVPILQKPLERSSFELAVKAATSGKRLAVQ
jgi:two-component sensor histidine kinase